MNKEHHLSSKTARGGDAKAARGRCPPPRHALVNASPLRFLRLIAVLCCSAAVGCDFSYTEPVVVAPVSGRVTLDGEPIEGARVVFISLGGNPGIDRDNMMSFGITDADGKFELKLDDERPGAVVGKHKVLVSKTLNKSEDQSGDNSVQTDRPPRPQTELIPERYNRSTELNFEVVKKRDASTTNHAEFDLKSN